MNDIIKNLESKENITNNDWRTVEQEIKYLYEMIKGIEVGATSFESITGLPEDNVALRAVLDGKASEVDLETLQGLVSTLQTAVSNVYTKNEVDNLLDDKADKTDTYTKTEVDTLLDGKVDKETGKELMPSTLPDRVSQNESDIQDLKDDKQDKMQFTEMPNPYTYLGKIVQYVGPTNTQYTNGLFYQGDYDSASLQYIWQPIGTSKGPEYEAGQGIEITDNVIKCTLLNDTLTSTLTTWSSQKLRQEFESIAGATKVYIVPELPTQGELNAIYYQGTEAPYNIYLYSSTNEWVLIGTTGVNLQNYYTKTEVDNLINTYKPASGAGTIIAGSQQGMRVNILCDNPLSIDNANQHLKLNYGAGLQVDNNNVLQAKTAAPISKDSNGIKLKYNEGLDVNSNDELKVNYGAGLKLNGSNNTIEADVDNTSVVLDSNDKISVPLKTINNESLYGSGNIAIGSAAQQRELTITQVNANIASVSYTYNTIEYPTFYINLLTLSFTGMNFAANTNIQVCNLRGLVGSAYGSDVWISPIKVANKGYLGTANQIVSTTGVNVFLLCNNALNNDTARVNISFITLKA